MLFGDENEIDIKFKNTFDNSTLSFINSETIDYIGINISSSMELDYKCKIYYANDVSYNLYKEHYKNDIIDYLYERSMVKNIEIVLSGNNVFGLDVRLKKRTNDNILNFANFMKKESFIFEKYYDEIIKLAKMKYSNDPDYKYASFYYLGYSNDINSLLKCYWTNDYSSNSTDLNDNYFFDYVQDVVIQFKPIVPIVKTALKEGGGKLFFEGIDYTPDRATSHKIYVANPIKPYQGLIAAIPKEYVSLHNKLIKTMEWHREHPNLELVIYAIGKDYRNNLNINLYYSITKKISTQI